MGKRTTTSEPSPSKTSKCVKMAAPAPTVNVPLIWNQVAPGNQPLPPHAINKHVLQFVDQEQTNHYVPIASRQITKPKYIDLGILWTLGLFESLNELLEEGERIFVNHLGQPLFQLSKLYKTTCSDPSSWVYDDDIDMDTYEDDSSPQGGRADEREGGAEYSGSAPHGEMLEPL
ncbi:hypothetical protein Cgig2_029923 [Carnegiea gigantea]|uniref:Uncharacterized protein n=1 Tax=Carnegiea gigantea TaxID=171969 RepID=A0A9Q1QIS4_9CARY|nr:hypothetical protein Cgig2_029923 [Carnegiea gigantea]